MTGKGSMNFSCRSRLCRRGSCSLEGISFQGVCFLIMWIGSHINGEPTWPFLSMGYPHFESKQRVLQGLHCRSGRGYACWALLRSCFSRSLKKGYLDHEKIRITVLVLFETHS